MWYRSDSIFLHTPFSFFLFKNVGEQLENVYKIVTLTLVLKNHRVWTSHYCTDFNSSKSCKCKHYHKLLIFLIQMILTQENNVLNPGQWLDYVLPCLVDKNFLNFATKDISSESWMKTAVSGFDLLIFIPTSISRFWSSGSHTGVEPGSKDDDEWQQASRPHHYLQNLLWRNLRGNLASNNMCFLWSVPCAIWIPMLKISIHWDKKNRTECHLWFATCNVDGSFPQSKVIWDATSSVVSQKFSSYTSSASTESNFVRVGSHA